MIKIHYDKIIASTPYGASIILPPNYPHKSTFYKITYFYDCECDIEFYSRWGGDRKTIKMKPNYAYIITPNDVHNFLVEDMNTAGYCQKDVYIFPEKMKEICDFISPTLFDELNKDEYPKVYKLSSNALFVANELHKNLPYVQINDETDSIHKVLVTFLLGQFIESKSIRTTYPDWLSELLDKMTKEDFITLSTEEMVKSTNYSHGYVCRQFKKYLKMSIKTYIIKQKLIYSCNMLTSTNKTLDEIAYKLSFSTLSNYIFLFKKEYGLTPGQYRREHN